MSSHDEIPNEELWSRAQSENLVDRADALAELASRHFQEDNFKMAKNLYGSAADLFDELEKVADQVRSLYWLANCEYRLGEYQNALENLTSALGIHFDNNDSRGIAYCASLSGDCFRELGKTEDAIESYELAIDSYLEIEDNWNLGLCSLSLGEIHGAEEHLTKALECFIRAFNAFQTCGDAYGAARTKDRMASALIELGDFEQAIQHIKDAMDTFEFMEAEERVYHMKYRLGWTYVLAGKYQKAEAPLREAIAQFKAVKDWSRAALAEVQLASALRLMDKDEVNDEAERLLTRTAAYFECAGEISNLLMVDSISAEKLMDIGLTEEAIDIYRSIISRGEEIADYYIVRSTKALLAQALLKTGEVEEAKELLSQISEEDWGENKFELERLQSIQKLVNENQRS